MTELRDPPITLDIICECIANGCLCVKFIYLYMLIGYTPS